METQAPYRVAFVATPPAACLLPDAMQAVVNRLQPLAEAVGLPGFSLSVSHDYCPARGGYTRYTLSARPADADWRDKRGVNAAGDMLAEVEAEFLLQLRDYERAANEANPTRRGEQFGEMYQVLATHALAA